MRVASYVLALLLLAGSAFAQGTGKGVVVAVIDSGVDFHHPALGGGFGPGYKVVGGWDFVSNDANPDDVTGQGTLIAGIIAADRDVPGIAPDAKLLAYRVGGGYDTPSPDVLALAIRRAVADGADVIQISVGNPGTPDDVAARAADEAVAAGVVVCAGVGEWSRIASVHSPAAARGAIAVGGVRRLEDGSYARALYGSAEGPASETITFKPDLMAPESVPMIALRDTFYGRWVEGTDTASAIVAGMAAVLLELHPDWSPAQVKSALVTTADPFPGQHPLRRGGGVVNFERAAAATTFVDAPGLMFGVHPKATGRASVTRWLTLSNRTAKAQHFTATTETASPVSMKITPEDVIVPAHGTARVKLQLSLVYESLPYAAGLVHGGDVVFRGKSELRVPWAFMRGARITVHTDLDGDWRYSRDTYAFGPDAAQEVYYTLENRGELWVRPGRWDFLQIGCRVAYPCRVITVEDQRIDGMNVVMMNSATATLPVELTATDDRGRFLRDLQEKPLDLNYDALLFVRYADRGIAYADVAWLTTPTVLVSPSSDRFTFVGTETFVDRAANRAFGAVHEPLRGIAGPHTMTRDSSSYKHATVGLSKPTKVCVWNSLTIAGPGIGSSCDEKFEGDFEFFATDGADFVEQSLAIYVPRETQMMLRSRDGEFVFMSGDDAPSPAAHRIAPEGRVDLDQGLLRPGIVPGEWAEYVYDRTGWFGSFDDQLIVPELSRFWLYDTRGAVLQEGLVQANWFLEELPENPEGMRYVAQPEGSDATVELTFGRTSHRTRVPSLTSLRIVDATRRLTKKIETGSAAWLEFSAVSYSKYPEGQVPMRVEGTKVRAGRNGVLRELPFVHTGSDNGSSRVLKHDPAGEMFRVNLAPVADLRGDVDLVIEVEDIHGAHLRWTLPRAFRFEER